MLRDFVLSMKVMYCACVILEGFSSCVVILRMSYFGWTKYGVIDVLGVKCMDCHCDRDRWWLNSGTSQCMKHNVGLLHVRE